MDTGSSESFIDERVTSKLQIKIRSLKKEISMAPRPDLVISYPGPICILLAVSVDRPLLFPNLPPNYKPIATKSWRFGKDGRDFIIKEVEKLLHQGIIKPSSSPWRAQVVVVKYPTHRHKKGLCVDYSQTIDQYTELDAHPLPLIEEIVNQVAEYRVFSTFDLKWTYQQIPFQ